MVSPWQWWRARATKTKHVKVDGMDSIQKTPRTAVVIVSLAVVAIFALSLWYFVQPQPLLVQGEADATRIDISARVDGRVARRRPERGAGIQGGQGQGDGAEGEEAQIIAQEDLRVMIDVTGSPRWA